MGVLRLGMRVDLLKPGIKLDSPESIDNRFASSIHDIDSDTSIVLTNPTLKARLVPLHSGERFDAYFFTKDNKIFSARLTVVKNRNDGGIRVVEFSIDSSVEKYDRRQYFRLETTMPIRYLLLTASNTAAFKEAIKSNTLLKMDGFKNGNTLDISGGGVKFTADEELPVGGLAIIHIEAIIDERKKNYIFVGKILEALNKKGSKGMFQHRTQFVDLKQDAREELVQFIFQCERERLKRRSI